MRKWLVLILALILISTLFLCSTLANAETYCNLTYENWGDHIEITGCEKTAVSVDIPAEIDGLPVTSIGDNAFYGCESLTSVVVPEGVMSIGEFAFSGCIRLKDIDLPDSLTKISFTAFMGGTAYSRDQKNWSDGVLYIGNHLIDANNDKINCSVSIREGTKCIADKAFFGCFRLGNIHIPQGVTSIGSYAFFECISLTSIDIPGSVTNIGNYAFEYCSNLTDVNIHSGVTSIGGGMFYDCSELKEVYLPSSITNIRIKGFYGCKKMENVYYGGNNKDWNNINFEADNEHLVYSNVHLNYNMPVSSISSSDENITITTNLNNIVNEDIKEKSKVFIVLYDKSSMLIDSYFADYNGMNIECTLKNDANADHIKVFVWNKDGSLEPITEAPEYIRINNN